MTPKTKTTFLSEPKNMILAKLGRQNSITWSQVEYTYDHTFLWFPSFRAWSSACLWELGAHWWRVIFTWLVNWLVGGQLIIGPYPISSIWLRIPNEIFYQENIKWDSLNNLPPIVSHYFFTLSIFNCKLKTINAPQIYFRITS